jgi:putative ABC transport system permease protein
MIGAVLRPLRRDPLYVSSGILALAVGLAAAILAFLYVRDELSFDNFLPGHDRIAVLVAELNTPGQSRIATDDSPGMLAAILKAELPSVAGVGRLAYDNVSVRHGDILAREDAVWVDPGFFDLLKLPRLAGDPGLAVQAPDGVVLTQSLARKYFPASRAVGSSLQIGAQVMQVRAVIKDVPANSHLAQLGVFLSGRSATSPLTRASTNGFYNMVVDLTPPVQIRYVRERTYVRLAPGFGVDAANRALARLGRAHAWQLHLPDHVQARFELVPLSGLHTYPFKGANIGASDLHADVASLADMAVLGALTLLLAATNFVNLATARAANRAREVGVRKASGASQAALVRLFLGEAFIQVLVATILAVSIVELALPSLNAFLMKDMRFDYGRDPWVAAALLSTVGLLTVLAGAYPAVVLASYRPAQSIRGGGTPGGGSAMVRHGLVAFQFCVLLVLLLGAAVVWAQARYATTEGLRLDKDGVLVVHVSPCRGPFADEVHRLPGVLNSGCGAKAMLGLDDLNPLIADALIRAPGHPTTMVALGLSGYGLFQTLGIAPIAGRLFLASHKAADELPPVRGPRRGSTILNESAVRRLGLARASDAVGRVMEVPLPQGGADHWTVIGVVPDFTLDLKSAPVKPTAYIIDAGYPLPQVLAVRLDGRRTPETLAAIGRLWNATGHAGAPHIQFLDDYVQRLYLATTRQAVLLSALCLIAALLACLGLLALSAYTAQRRTKEIGVRKAMGAAAGDIVALLLLQFSRPVGLGILIGAPIAYLAARRWLEGFSYHIALRPWLFAAAALAAIVIGLGAGLFHALAVARGRPADALRYE